MNPALDYPHLYHESELYAAQARCMVTLLSTSAGEGQASSPTLMTSGPALPAATGREEGARASPSPFPPYIKQGQNQLTFFGLVHQHPCQQGPLYSIVLPRWGAEPVFLSVTAGQLSGSYGPTLPSATDEEHLSLTHVTKWQTRGRLITPSHHHPCPHPQNMASSALLSRLIVGHALLSAVASGGQGQLCTAPSSWPSVVSGVIDINIQTMAGTGP